MAGTSVEVSCGDIFQFADFSFYPRGNISFYLYGEAGKIPWDWVEYLVVPVPCFHRRKNSLTSFGALHWQACQVLLLSLECLGFPASIWQLYIVPRACYQFPGCLTRHSEHAISSRCEASWAPPFLLQVFTERCSGGHVNRGRNVCWNSWWSTIIILFFEMGLVRW